MLHLLTDVLRNSLLITGLVIIMMIGIEFINVGSNGRWFSKLEGSKRRQVLLGALLGLVPGCIGGFAAVSLYSHRLLSFGALVAMMICSSGDEAFVMLAMIPEQALLIFAILFVIACAAGLLTDKFFKKPLPIVGCDQEFEIHHHDHQQQELASPWKAASYRKLRHASSKKIITLIGIGLFIAAMFVGLLEHDHNAHVPTQATEYHCHEIHSVANVHPSAETHVHEHTLNIFSERWLNIAFAILSLGVLLLAMTSNEHFIQEHIWNHVIRKHFLSIFLWTFGALLLIHLGLQYLDIEDWLHSNTLLMILIAALIGIIPESGPHMIFITLFASGLAPFSVLLTSSIAQDGHTTLPLLAQSKRSFVLAKLINIVVAIAVGMLFLLIGY
ncbi:MAG: arsenic efflux protein [Bacteroidales bacterium]|nr:arsenic efflux protein [Bacteroidales bacterium]